VKHLFNYVDYITEKYLLPKSHRTKNLLYHASSFNNILSILKQNRINGTVGYDFGVATSRNKDYLFLLDFETGDIIRGGADAQFILDRDKLKARYKIQAFDWEEMKQSDDHNHHQAEDKVLTSAIESIDRYIMAIQLNKAVHRNFQILWADNHIREKIIVNKWDIFDSEWKLLVDKGVILQDTKPKYNYTIHDQNEYYADATFDTPNGKILITGQFSEERKELNIVAYHNNYAIANADFVEAKHFKGEFETKHVFVKEEFRRLGIASVMHDIAITMAAATGVKIEQPYKSNPETKDLMAMWKSF
jgi:hypothetical protein